MEALGAFSGIFILFLIVVATLSLLLPFFVLRIRNEIISVNEKLSTVIRLIGDEQKDGNVEVDHKGRKVKTCQHCGLKNRAEDWMCYSCNQPI